MPEPPKATRAAGGSLINGGHVAGLALTLLSANNKDFSKNKMAQWACTRSGLVARWFRHYPSWRSPALSAGKFWELGSEGSWSLAPGPAASALEDALSGMLVLCSTLTSCIQTLEWAQSSVSLIHFLGHSDPEMLSLFRRKSRQRALSFHTNSAFRSLYVIISVR